MEEGQTYSRMDKSSCSYPSPPNLIHSLVKTPKLLSYAYVLYEADVQISENKRKEDGGVAPNSPVSRDRITRQDQRTERTW